LHKQILLLLLALMVLIDLSCYRDPFSIDLSEFGQTIVIEGYITDQLGLNSVRISRTVPRGRRNEFPAITNAVVTIQEDSETPVQLFETGPGIYQATDMTGQPGHTYTLTVITGGNKYSASSTMPQALEFNRVELYQTAPGATTYRPRCTLNDHAGINNFYLLNIYRNDFLEDTYLYHDALNDGEEVMLDNISVYLEARDRVLLELLTVNKIIYEFFDTLDELQESEGDEVADSFIPITTINPTTNLENGALGYFSAHTTRKYIRTAGAPF